MDCDKITKIIFDLYQNLGKSGKPIKGSEWTHLSAFVIEDNEFKVVSLATGTKCLGASLLDRNGFLVGDSHAEVLARRGFLRYLFEQVKITKNKGSSFLFSGLKDGKCLMKNIKIHFFTSHVPCGDASIIPMTDQEITSKKRKSTFEDTNCKKIKSDVHRTGAKPVHSETRQDLKEDGDKYHVIGAVRNKPGRGDRTNSLSCSDKISRWIYSGLQGALLSQLVKETINIDSIIIGGGGQYSEEILKNSLIKRSSCPRSPNIFRSNLIFEDGISNAKPCPTSLIWSDVSQNKLEIAVNGKRLGVTKKSKDKGRLSICRYELFKNYLDLKENLSHLTYLEAKKKAVDYCNISETFKSAMGAWSCDKTEFKTFKILET